MTGFNFEVVDAAHYDELRPEYAPEAVAWVAERGGIAPSSRVVDLAAGTLYGGDVWAKATNGGFDGFRFDTAGRCWMSAADGVHVLDPDGTLLGKVFVPEPVANLVFGGPKSNRLFICGTSSLYSVLLPVNGIRTF